MIKNFIQINGEYVEQKDIDNSLLKEISQHFAEKLADGFGYEKTDEKFTSAQSA